MSDAAHSASSTLLSAASLAVTLDVRHAANGVRHAQFGDTGQTDAELDRLVQTIPAAIAPALAGRVFYFVPLALPEPGARGESHRGASETTLVAAISTSELSDEAICHRNVSIDATEALPAHEGVFISVRLLRDTFSLAFELFINVGHIVAAEAGIPAAFATLAWTQALADVRGETSQDAFESRNQAVAGTGVDKTHPDEKARAEFIESAFADAVAIYLLSLAVDFDYSELREREYPLLAPSALADRLRLVAHLFPPNEGYEFSVRYRRRA